MKRMARILTPWCLAISAFFGGGAAATAWSADAQPSYPVRLAVRSRQTTTGSELRLVKPNELPSGGGTYAAAQPGPVAPDEPAAAADMPPIHALPPTAKEAEDIDGSWKPIGAVGVTITNPAGELPADLAAPRFTKAGMIYPPAAESRNWSAYDFYWVASGSVNNPLYFEEPNLERYGYKFGCLQPAVSAAHFFATIPLLPYKMVVHPPQECVYTLGYYRPGDCVPLQRERFHLEPDAAAAEAGAVIGLILLFN